MNWVLASLLMFASSVALYTSIRKAQLMKISIEVYSLFMFGVPALAYLFFIVAWGLPYRLPVRDLIEIFAAAVLFSYLGNFFSQKSILKAPNPGYSLMISKSYIVFTTIAAIFLFNASLTLKSSVAILMILAFSSMIASPTEPKGKGKGKSWLAYSFGAFFCWGLLALALKHFLLAGIEIFVTLFYLTAVVSGIIFFEIKAKRMRIALEPKDLLIVLAIGGLSALFNAFMNLGYQTAPNIGYLNAVNASSIAFVTVLSSVFFKDHLSAKKVIGIVGSTIGLIVLLV
ncbi:hypothetical protein A3K63_04335 [Candidatus Micrarchaeota archaeon RBG_16_49_10]|nr:MAG: hypothetical protein A3K63_04335 [Candidatus Micrarchaeota archaeon RBG_16_49_10]